GTQALGLTIVNQARACSRSAANCSALKSLIEAATALTPETIPPIAVRSGSSGESSRSSLLRKASAPDEASGAPDSRLARSRNSAATAEFRACASGTVTTPNGVAKIGTTCGAGLLIGAPQYRRPEAGDRPGTRAGGRAPARSDGRG